jgi:hypothetical protein
MMLFRSAATISVVQTVDLDHMFHTVLVFEALAPRQTDVEFPAFDEHLEETLLPGLLAGDAKIQQSPDILNLLRPQNRIVPCCGSRTHQFSICLFRG